MISQLKWKLRSLWRRPPELYKGLVVRCSPGAHGAAVAMLKQAGTAPGAALDLASGSGALLARLSDAGFSDFTSVELYNIALFDFPGVTARDLDLNTAFAEQFDRRFDLVSAIEIIEHLDCPRHFLRQVHALLLEDGRLLLSLPNLGHWLGRIRFLLRGEHRFFLESDYHGQRHISPVTDAQMRFVFAETGFRLLDQTTAGSFQGPLQRTLLSPIAFLFRLLFGRRVVGDVSVYLLEKCAPQPHRDPSVDGEAVRAYQRAVTRE